MTLTEMIAALRFRLGNKKGHDADFLREIQFAQRRLEKDPEIDYWFLVQESTLLLPANIPDVVFPDGFIREYDNYPPLLELGEGFSEFTRMDENEAKLLFADSVGQPEVYVIHNGSFRIYPIPDKDYTMHFDYIRKQAVLTTAEPVVDQNQWTVEAEQILLNKAGIALAQAFRDKDALANFTNDFQTAKAEMITEMTAREEVNMSRQRGGSTNALGN